MQATIAWGEREKEREGKSVNINRKSSKYTQQKVEKFTTSHGEGKRTYGFPQACVYIKYKYINVDTRPNTNVEKSG